MKTLIENLKESCCAKTIIPNSANLNEVKLYDTISDASNETTSFNWHSLGDVFAFNSAKARPTGIVCHTCSDDKNQCIISLIIDNKENTRFCLADKMEIR